MKPDKEASGCLYLVATPIGNLGDLSARACETIKRCDLVACEDTRVSAKLLQHIGITLPMISYREENERSKSTELAGEIQKGKRVALLSDAGFPCISDPGFRLVRECHLGNLPIVPIPGPNAAITALAASGLPTHQFLYLGFLPKKSSQIRSLIQKWKDFEGSLIFYESKYKIPKTLEILLDSLGPYRYISLSRELTKAYESISTGPLHQIIEKQKKSSGKGEFTVVIAPEKYTFN